MFFNTFAGDLKLFGLDSVCLTKLSILNIKSSKTYSFRYLYRVFVQTRLELQVFVFVIILYVPLLHIIPILLSLFIGLLRPLSLCFLRGVHANPFLLQFKILLFYSNFFNIISLLSKHLHFFLLFVCLYL